MTYGIRDAERKLYSYYDNKGNYCEVWGASDGDDDSSDFCFDEEEWRPNAINHGVHRRT